MAKLFQFFIFCILQLYLLSFKIPLLYANHLCSPDQSLSLLDFKESLQIETGYRETYTNEFGLYQTTYIDHYCGIVGSKISSWNSSTDCCSWEGIICDEFTGNVVELDLSFSRLAGEIHSNSSIFQLSHLKRLNLAYNFLISEISPEFHRLTHLAHLNLTNAGFQGQIPSEISQLNELVSLDLSGNYEPFLEPHVFKVLVQNMSKLRELYLEGVNITSSLPNNLSTSLTVIDLAATNLKGAFPYHIFRLPNLQQLSLGYNSFDGFDSSTSVIWNTSSSLEKLELQETVFSKKLLDTIGNLKHLAYLDLSSCFLKGTLPHSFASLTQLSHLDLSHNNFSGQIPQEILGLEHLTLLDIGWNNLDAPTPHSSSNNMRSLKVLSLPNNKLTTSSVSSVLSNLTRLEAIDLSFNPLYEIPLDLFELSFLQRISLRFTHLHGPIPLSFSNLVNLKYLNLVSNQLSGPIEIDTFSNNLMYLNLASNNFTGPIDAFSNLVNLKYLNLASNNFSGPMETDAFSNLVHLITLDLSSNNFGCDLDVRFLSNIRRMDGLNLSFSSLSLINENNTTLPTTSINSLLLDSCNITDLDVLRSIVVVEDLHLSNNNIHGEIPDWVWSNWSNITFLDLSNNFITRIGSKIPLQSLRGLNIGSNLLQGELPDLPPNIWTLSLSNNQLHGEIKSSICEQRDFAIVDLSNNSLTGALPHCISKAEFLDLHMNNLQGTIPDTFSMRSVQSLNLRGNHFEGKIPRSLMNVSYLVFLDLSENNLTDAFPIWLGDLPSLSYLSLRFNKLYGPISSSHASEYAFSGLQILDISHNQLNGHVPTRLLEGFKQMMSASNTSNYSGNRFGGLASQQYYISMTMVLNGITIQLDRISYALKIMDLSCNHFEGEIPSSVGGLIGIRQLNLSHNNFTGLIPPQLGNLSYLQSLGLSYNQLDGNIPRQLADLGFLSVLNLSYNNLTGQIPTGRQLQTISNESYIGNDGLCGFPLSRKCGDDNSEVLDPDEEDNQEFFDGFTWQSVVMGYGVGLCIGFVIGIIMLFNEKSKWLIQVVMEEAHRMGHKLKTRNGSSLNITSMNNLHGTIPDNFSSNMENLNLPGNHFEGEVPRSLINCSQLEVIDLSENNFNDTFPIWLGDIPNLRVLSLRYNKFYGPVFSRHA